MNKNIKEILSEFDLKKFSGNEPSEYHVLKEIEELSTLNNQTVQDNIASFLSIYNSNPNLKDNQTLKVLIYALGVSLFDLTILRQIKESINSAMRLFEQTILIDGKYFQAYHRLGNCLLYCPQEEYNAISCFKTSIEYEETSIVSVFQTSHSSTWLGENYLGIGLALARLNRIDDALVFISESKSLLGELTIDNGLVGYFNFSFNNWDEVFDFIKK